MEGGVTMRRKIALLLTVLMSLTMLCMSINAAEPVEYGLQWDNITMVRGGELTFEGTSGNYSVSIIGNAGVERITATVDLYYKNFWGSWVEVDMGWEYDVDSDTLSIDEDFTGVSGREYKAVLTATVYLDGVGEEVTKTSTADC